MNNLQDKKYIYVSDSQEVREICNDAGLNADDTRHIAAAVVAIGDGEYTEIWLTESTHPYLLSTTYYTPDEWSNDNEPDSVALIASGYEWICPKCDTLNDEVETKERVTCSSCGASWTVDDYYHAEG